MKKSDACFLDRDGVLIEEEHYLSNPDQVRLYPGAAGALRGLRAAGFLVVVVTNQSGVARGYYPEEAIAAIHRRIDEILARENAAVDAYYHCPHHPGGEIDAYTTDCHCRKPAPGMLLRAADDLNIDLSASFMVGDKLSDIGAARAAGCRDAFLVRTGHGAQEAGMADGCCRVFDDIAAAAEYMVGIKNS